MGTLASALALAQQALMANQTALNITANNVANQNTPGYTREVATWTENDSVTIGNVSVGQGASIGAAASQRDLILEKRVQQQTQVQAQSQSLEDALNQVQSIFGLSSSSTSASSTALGTALNGFYNALSSLTANPSDSATRQKVISAASNLVGAFNSTSNQMAGVASDLDKQVSGYVDNVNGLLSTIATLNQKISNSSPNSDAGVLEDQRQQAIAQLSQYIGLDQITNENNQITLTTTNGAVLVSGAQSYAMSTSQISGQTHIMAGIPPQDVTAGLTGGALGGALEARDQLLPQYQSSLDELAYQIGTQVNQVNAQGLDGNGNPGAAIFQLPGSANGAAVLIGMATTDPQSIAAAAVGEGSTGTSNALLLAGLANGATVSGQTPLDFLTSLMGQIGNAAASASSDNTVQQATLTQLTSQRNSLSSVSLDEEAANLTQYQRAYQAAAKIFSITDELMASAINLGVTTSVS
ncbi:flagellar hook-associated protein FlgK [Edaphobacter modestus]|uniref:Flagellar hook-associated protein 1 n=1 Tax=Edaphobacter modestus TaxID=388466 RepID=A0A4Q7YQV3_9BACT|nr:flagellar hook-associated protein FlgK [Edaphobacter modestus]RZU39544.1 flagellar hook-associated protein 1 FlgK [Edaphobacter modestus]